MNPKCVVCGKEVEEYENGDPRVCVECWKCPRCGVGTYYKDDYIREGLILEEESVCCYKCDMYWTPRKFEAAIAKKHNRVKCPYCKGTGYADKDGKK